MTAVYARLERMRDRATWEKSAYLATWIANSSGMRKRPVTFQQAMPRFRDNDAPPVDMEKRRREAEETLRIHKAKFWTLLRGPTLDDIQTDIPDEVLNRMKPSDKDN